MVVSTKMETYLPNLINFPIFGVNTWQTLKPPPSSIRSRKKMINILFITATHMDKALHTWMKRFTCGSTVFKSSKTHTSTKFICNALHKTITKTFEKRMFGVIKSPFGQKACFRRHMLVSGRVYKFRVEFSWVNIDISSVGATARFSSETVSCLNSFLGLPTMCWKNLNVQLDNQKSSLCSCLLSWW